MAATGNYENHGDNVEDTADADNSGVSSVDFAATSTNCENTAASGVININAISETEALNVDTLQQNYDGDSNNICRDDPTVEYVAAERKDFQVNNRLQASHVEKTVPSVAAAAAASATTTTTIMRRIVVANVNAVAAAAVKATAATVVFVPARPPTNC